MVGLRSALAVVDDGGLATDSPPDVVHPVVLVVDDEPSMRSVLERLLRMRGCVPMAAVSVREAVLLADATHVDAFIIDLNLARGHSGLDVLHWLRGQQQYHATPVFFVTGQVDLSEDVLQYLQAQRAHLFYKGQSLQPLIDELLRLTFDGGS
jgi:CheY-like chemotaxis protein